MINKNGHCEDYRSLGLKTPPLLKKRGGVNFDIKFVRLLYNLISWVRNCSDAVQKLKTKYCLFKNSIKILKQSIREKNHRKVYPPSHFFMGGGGKFLTLNFGK